MTLIAIMLITVGVADVVRRRERFASMTWPVPSLVIALVLPPVLALAVGLTSPQDWLMLLAAAGTALAWILTSHRSFARDEHHGLPLGILIGGLAVMALVGASTGTDGFLTAWLSEHSLPGIQSIGGDRALLILGALLVQISTGNLIVRLVLTHIGAIRPFGEPQPADRLKGGRLLGPMERIFILGLGLAGQVTAAGLVIAAKGIIRFPELQAQARAEVDGVPDLSRPSSTKRGPGIDELTEYFLIGSFVSWLVALSTLALVWLG
ncbi:MAG: hypothetical protein Q4G67_05810 [Actinomycetia bacterium]|nr:hypothetical protein [Actinomycetes bacterium]